MSYGSGIRTIECHLLYSVIVGIKNTERCIENKNAAWPVELTETRGWSGANSDVVGRRVEMNKKNSMIEFITNIKNVVVGDRYADRAIKLTER